MTTPSSNSCINTWKKRAKSVWADHGGPTGGLPDHLASNEGQAELTRELLNRADGKISDRLEISQRSLSLHIDSHLEPVDTANQPKQDLGELPRESAALPDPTIHEGEKVSSK